MKVLFWDLDHTLWDFKKNSREALREGYDEFDLASYGVGDIEEYIEAYEKANDWCWKEYREGRMEKAELRGKRFKMAMEPWGLVETQELGEKLGKHYVKTSPHKTNLFEGAKEVLSELQDRGHKQVILTNGFEEVQHIKVEKCGLLPYFDEVITSDTMGYKKPHPMAFSLALERVGARADNVVMIGDNLDADVLGAKAQNIAQIFFNPNSNPHQEEIDYEVRTLREILDIELH
ncbi:MAG: YjjG family noncanonical pyrimidine nucleotidase [Bacteroidota bacterium]|nr:YjjG family noncanonical pyrimidine nucleotidase [Bacteroidota bacterium]